MKHSSIFAASALAALFGGLVARPAPAQDPVEVAPSIYKVLLDNDHVRVLDIRLKRGAKSPSHSHPAYIAYALTPSKVRFTSPDGKTAETELPAGQAVWRDAETHAAENIGRSELHVLNIELKELPPAPEPSVMAAGDPLEVGAGHYKVLLDNDRVRVLEASDKPGEKIGLHRHPAHVVYALKSFKRRFSYADGQSEVVELKAGTAIWSGALVHAGENVGSSDTRALIIELKFPPSAASIVNIRPEEVKWETMMPELGDGSPEIAILRVDPKTQATQLMIRVRRAFHVPAHWHSANETHTVLSGRFLIECHGVRALLGPGGFNYIPARAPHEAWVEPEADRPYVVFITVDGAWDNNWVSGPPTAADMDVAMPEAR